ncbi:MAG: hypothetical protein HY049_15810 [Acidobacteria bacterium]|nr:hypothetical protein [Acidobacteriota bacterium]
MSLRSTKGLTIAAVMALFVAGSSSLGAAAAVAYRLRHVAGSCTVHVEIAIPDDAPGAADLVMPRAIPMGYGIQHYDRHVSGVTGAAAGGTPGPLERSEGPRWRPRAPVSTIAYDVDVAAMEREILAGSDASKCRDGYLGLLGYSVFGYVDGLEDRPITLEFIGSAEEPVFTTLAPAAPPPRGRATAKAADYYALADSQILLGSGFDAVRVEGGAPALFVAVHAEAEVDRPRLGAMARRALDQLVAYFGPAPFDHYTIVFDVLKPITPAHEYGFAMEHLESSTFGVGTSADDLRGLSPGAPDDATAVTEFWIAHHVAHAWIPKRGAGEGYFPHTWETPPILDSIWFAEGFGQYVAIDAQADALPDGERAAFRARRVRLRFRKSLETAPTFMLRMPLVQLSRVASTMYGDDFRTGRTVFSRGGLMAAEMDEAIRSASAGSKRLRDAMRAIVARSAHGAPGFGTVEFPDLIRQATGVDVRAIFEKWLGPFEPPPLR